MGKLCCNFSRMYLGRSSSAKSTRGYSGSPRCMCFHIAFQIKITNDCIPAFQTQSGNLGATFSSKCRQNTRHGIHQRRHLFCT